MDEAVAGDFQDDEQPAAVASPHGAPLAPTESTEALYGGADT
jgi:hypothetical protein